MRCRRPWRTQPFITILIASTGDAYGDDRNKFHVRMVDGKGGIGDWALPDWQAPETRGLDLIVAFNGTSGKHYHAAIIKSYGDALIALIYHLYGYFLE